MPPGLSQLRCLCIKGTGSWNAFPTGISNLPLLTALSLENGSLSCGTSCELAELHRLSALRLDCTDADDVTIACLTYGARLRQWASASGVRRVVIIKGCYHVYCHETMHPWSTAALQAAS